MERRLHGQRTVRSSQEDDEQGPTQVKLGQAKHLYDVRAKKYLGRTDTARLDLTKRAAAVLALMPYQVTGVEVQVTPGQCTPGRLVRIRATVRSSQGNPGDHVLRMEVYGPSGALSRAYTDNVLAVAGRFERPVQTAINDQPGRWRIVVTDVISGRKSEAAYELGGER